MNGPGPLLIMPFTRKNHYGCRHIIAGGCMLGLALLLAAAPAFAGKPHYVVVRVYKGQAEYTQTVQVTEDIPREHSAQALDMDIYTQILLVRNRADSDAPLTLQYTVRVDPFDVSGKGRSLDVQGEVAINPGSNITVVECGFWKVKIALDTKKNIKTAAWEAKGLPNYRLTVDTHVGGKKQLYRVITKAGSKSQVGDYTRTVDSYGFTFQSTLLPDTTSGSILQLDVEQGFCSNPLQDRASVFRLQYDIKQGFGNTAKPLLRQDELRIGLGCKAKIAGGSNAKLDWDSHAKLSEQAYRLEFLLEGKPPSPEKKGGETGPRAASDYGTIPIIK